MLRQHRGSRSQRRGGGARLVRVTSALIGAAALTVVVSCSSPDTEFEYLRLQVDGQPTLAITKKDIFIRGVVIYFHGTDDDEFALTSGDARSRMTENLVNAGFAVVSSRAGGNAFTSPQTLQNYRELGSMAIQHYRIENVYLLAESAGAIPAVNLLASSFTPIRGLAAVRPAFGVPDNSVFSSTTEEPVAPALPVADPMTMPPDSLHNRHVRLYVSEDDPQTEVADANAFAERYERSANVSTVDCSGGSAESQCLQGDDIVKWFTQLG